MTEKKTHSRLKSKYPLRDLYLLFMGLFDEVSRDAHLLSGGPFELEGFPALAERLIKQIMADDNITEAQKIETQSDYDFVISVYERSLGVLSKHNGVSGRPQLPYKPDYSAKRESINNRARELLRS